MNDDKFLSCDEESLELSYTDFEIQKKLLEYQFPSSEIILFSKDEYLVLYYSILKEIERIDNMESLDPSDDSLEMNMLTLYQNSYPGTILEKEKLMELTSFLKDECIFFESLDAYLVPMPCGWQQHMFALIKGSALLFRGSMEEMRNRKGVNF